MGIGSKLLSVVSPIAGGFLADKERRDAEKQGVARMDEQYHGAKAEQKRIEDRMMEFYGLTNAEKDRESRMFDLEKAYGGRIGKEAGMTGEQLFGAEGDLNTALLNAVLQDAMNPGGSFEDTLGSQLELARQMINEEAIRTGRFGGLPQGGIRFENLGRAGAEMAIKSAEARQAARQQDLGNASALATQILNLGQNADSRQATFLGGLQGLTEGARNRQATGAQVGSQLGLQPVLPAAADLRGAIGDVFGARLADAYKTMDQSANTLSGGMGMLTGGMSGGGSPISGGIQQLQGRAGAGGV